MSILSTILGGLGGAATAIPLLAGLFTGGSAAGQAGRQAEQMSAEQRALLNQILQWSQQYGGPLLEQGWDWAQNPYETAFERAQWQRGRQDLERAYRPAYGGMLQGLSQRGMLSSSLLPEYTGALDRARAGDVGRFFLNLRAHKGAEKGRRLEAFGNLLSQLRGGNVAAAGAYSSPISTYANLAGEAGAGMGNTLGGLLQWLMMQNMTGGGKTNTGKLIASPYLASGYGAKAY